MGLSKFAGGYNAVSFNYGGLGVNTPPALVVASGPGTTGSQTLIVYGGKITLTDGSIISVLNTNAPVNVINASGQDLQTPTAVSTNVQSNIYGPTATLTATFTYAHYAGDRVSSGTVGLQEALNYVGSLGGGDVILDYAWVLQGGTQAMINAAVVPANVSIQDNRTGGAAQIGLVPSSVTVLAAPTALSTAAATNGLITTATTGGSIPATSTYRLGVTYVDAFGGETTLSVDTASTATIASGSGSTNIITVTSPAALAGAVGYRVYMTAASGASLSEILYPVGNAAITGTAVTSTVTGNGALASFQIGTPVTITAIITGTAKVPAQSSAYASAPVAPPIAPVVSYPPFTALGTIAAAATGTVAQVNFPAGFLNTVGRTVRIKGMYYATTNGTAGTITTQNVLASVFGVTSITPFTAVTASIAASTLTLNFLYEVTYVTQTVGATGTLECHGSVEYNIAGTAVGSVAMDSVIAVSSAVDLTKQLTLSVSHLNTTVGTSVSQNRILTVEVLQ